MIERCHDDGMRRSVAVYSDCETYRYALTREWGAGPRLAWVMLNPSTADERRNDPTIERCERRSRQMGYGGFRVVNLFAFRATRPADLRASAAPVGPDNDAAILDAAHWADAVICAWGAHGGFGKRDRLVGQMLAETDRPLFHLGLTLAGAPRHPLYVAYAQGPRRWNP